MFELFPMMQLVFGGKLFPQITFAGFGRYAKLSTAVWAVVLDGGSAATAPVCECRPYSLVSDVDVATLVLDEVWNVLLVRRAPFLRYRMPNAPCVLFGAAHVLFFVRLYLCSCSCEAARPHPLRSHAHVDTTKGTPSPRIPAHGSDAGLSRTSRTLCCTAWHIWR